MPTTLIELALRLVILLIEGIPAHQRQAQATIWFWMWWPIAKLWLSEENQKSVEAIMKDERR